jgi:hypothetical protein
LEVVVVRVMETVEATELVEELAMDTVTGVVAAEGK